MNDKAPHATLTQEEIEALLKTLPPDETPADAIPAGLLACPAKIQTHK